MTHRILMMNAREKLEVANNLFENGYYGDTVSHHGLISQFGLDFVKRGKFNHEVFDLFYRAQKDREEAD